MKKIAVGVSGASGAHLGLRLIAAASQSCEVYAVISGGAKKVLLHEAGLSLDDFLSPKEGFPKNDDAAAPYQKEGVSKILSRAKSREIDFSGIAATSHKEGSLKDRGIATPATLSQNLDEILSTLNHKNIKFFSDNDLAAPISSGSFKLDGAIVAPCSINTLAKISNGIADTLITRFSAVALKQRTPLTLGVREMPFSAISLRQMSELSALGVIVAPPTIGYYSDIKSIDDIENFIVGKWLDTLGVENQIYKRWEQQS